jgi:hypothetical protein
LQGGKTNSRSHPPQRKKIEKEKHELKASSPPKQEKRKKGKRKNQFKGSPPK